MRTVNRRDFLQLAAAPLFAQLPAPERRRTFEITTRIQILKPAGPTRVWLPMPLAVAPYQNTLGDTYHAPGGSAVMVENDDLDILIAEWDEGVEPILTVTNRVSTTARTANLTTPTVPPPLDAHVLDRFLRPTKLIPTDAMVKTKADAMTRGPGTDFERARAIYDWVVARTAVDSDTRVDPNVLVVHLARTSAIPARCVWGLGLASSNATKAQQCRAEVYLTGYGWVPVDATTARLFGSWDMNWIAFNYAHDVVLPRSKRDTLGFFMYPQAETANGRLDSLDPDTFKYEITAREV
jgi:transglutaminase-like putative cysteine protease